jgi:hypothetical protein
MATPGRFQTRHLVRSEPPQRPKAGRCLLEKSPDHSGAEKMMDPHPAGRFADAGSLEQALAACSCATAWKRKQAARPPTSETASPRHLSTLRFLPFVFSTCTCWHPWSDAGTLGPRRWHPSNERPRKTTKDNPSCCGHKPEARAKEFPSLVLQACITFARGALGAGLLTPPPLRRGSPDPAASCLNPLVT